MEMGRTFRILLVLLAAVVRVVVVLQAQCRSDGTSPSLTDALCNRICEMKGLPCNVTGCVCKTTSATDTCYDLNFAPSNRVAVNETIKPGTAIFRIPVNGQETWEYSLERGGSVDGSAWSDLSAYFKLSKIGDHYEMIVNVTPDLEEIFNRYHIKLTILTLMFTCKREGLQDQNTEIFLEVMPVNEYDPKFFGPLTQTVPEDTKVNTSIYQLSDHAIDLDMNPVTNELSAFGLHQYLPDVMRDGRAYFEMKDILQGTIVLKTAVDYEALHPLNATQFFLNVSASDIHGLTSYTTLVITVADVDDLPPEFYHPGCPLVVTKSKPCLVSYEASIPLHFTGQITNIVPGLVQARDMDSLGYEIGYSLEQGPGEKIDNLRKFSINETTGSVYVVSAFIQNTEVLLVIVAKEKSQLARSTQASLYVTADDTTPIDIGHVEDGSSTSRPKEEGTILDNLFDKDMLWAITLSMSVLALILLITVIVLCIKLCTRPSRRIADWDPALAGKDHSNEPSSFHKSQQQDVFYVPASETNASDFSTSFADVVKEPKFITDGSNSRGAASATPLRPASSSRRDSGQSQGGSGNRSHQNSSHSQRSGSRSQANSSHSQRSSENRNQQNSTNCRPEPTNSGDHHPIQDLRLPYGFSSEAATLVEDRKKADVLKLAKRDEASVSSDAETDVPSEKIVPTDKTGTVHGLKEDISDNANVMRSDRPIREDERRSFSDTPVTPESSKVRHRALRSRNANNDVDVDSNDESTIGLTPTDATPNSDMLHRSVSLPPLRTDVLSFLPLERTSVASDDDTLNTRLSRSLTPRAIRRKYQVSSKKQGVGEKATGENSNSLVQNGEQHSIRDSAPPNFITPMEKEQGHGDSSNQEELNITVPLRRRTKKRRRKKGEQFVQRTDDGNYLTRDDLQMIIPAPLVDYHARPYTHAGRTEKLEETLEWNRGRASVSLSPQRRKKSKRKNNRPEINNVNAEMMEGSIRTRPQSYGPTDHYADQNVLQKQSNRLHYLTSLSPSRSSEQEQQACLYEQEPPPRRHYLNARVPIDKSHRQPYLLLRHHKQLQQRLEYQQQKEQQSLRCFSVLGSHGQHPQYDNYEQSSPGGSQDERTASEEVDSDTVWNR